MSEEETNRATKVDEAELQAGDRISVVFEGDSDDVHDLRVGIVKRKTEEQFEAAVNEQTMAEMRRLWGELEPYLQEAQAFWSSPTDAEAMAKKVRELMRQLLCDKPHDNGRCEFCGYRDPLW